MTTSEKKLEFWNARAQFGEAAGTNDLPLKAVEMQALSQYVRDGQSVLDIGCGNGLTAFRLLEQFRIDIVGIDFAERMIEEANRLSATQARGKAVRFAVGDVRQLSRVPAVAGRKFDVVVTERVLINLGSWEEQKLAMRDIVDLLSPDGIYLMCENLEEGLASINQARSAIDLPAIEKPWHNRYLREREVQEIDFATLQEYRDISSTYYFLSRIVNAWVAKQNNEEPRYDSPINQLSLRLGGLRNLESAGFGQTRLWVWKRKNP
jgi:ubiquinone/menaquinone biosynthesis C-methylase UbiE